MSAVSLNLVFVTFLAFVMLTNGSPIETIEANDIILCPEGSPNACKTSITNSEEILEGSSDFLGIDVGDISMLFMGEEIQIKLGEEFSDYVMPFVLMFAMFVNNCSAVRVKFK